MHIFIYLNLLAEKNLFSCLYDLLLARIVFAQVILLIYIAFSFCFRKRYCYAIRILNAFPTVSNRREIYD